MNQLPVPDWQIDHIVACYHATGDAAPVIVGSPHSGSFYPVDFRFSCPLQDLQHAEDTAVDRLCAGAMAAGASLIAAQFPRSYIDVNRAIDDIDPGMIDGEWPAPTRISEKSRLGMGLVRTLCKPGVPVYARVLTLAEMRNRIDGYYLLYHRTLQKMTDDIMRRFGMVILLDCHSMPSLRDAAAQKFSPYANLFDRADIVLGDLDGQSCAPEISGFIAGLFRQSGYRVAMNDPYKGVEILRRHGHPHHNRHGLQIEINRALYMNEKTLALQDGFDKVQRDLAEIFTRICYFATHQLLAAAAD